MAMNADHRLVDVRDSIDQLADAVFHMIRSRIADGVRNVHRRCTGINDSFDHAAQKIDLRPRRILRRKLDVVAEAFCQLHTLDRSPNNLIGPHL